MLPPQAWLSPGRQSRSPVQAPKAYQLPLLQVRLWKPQLPHSSTGLPSHF